MTWRIVLAGTIWASLSIAYLLPVPVLSRFLISGLLFSILTRLGFALTVRLRTTFTRFLQAREKAVFLNDVRVPSYLVAEDKPKNFKVGGS